MIKAKPKNDKSEAVFFAKRYIMGLSNLLGISINIFTQTYTVDINFIGKFIGFLVGLVGVGFGVILFSLALKLVTLPFDVIQRKAMRKQNIQMKENQERMEKLQKQYANDKEMYNQKVMEMYKENGMSMFSSCLPMILSMVIFFIAIGAFNSYSAYANVENYNDLVSAYNSVLLDKVADTADVGCDFSVISVEEVKNKNGEITEYVFTYQVKDDTLSNDKVLYYQAKYHEKNLELVEFKAENDGVASIRYKKDGENNIPLTSEEVRLLLRNNLKAELEEEANADEKITKAERKQINAALKEAAKYEKTYFINDEKITSSVTDVDVYGYTVQVQKIFSQEDETEVVGYEFVYSVANNNTFNGALPVINYTVKYIENDLELVSYDETNPANSVRYKKDGETKVPLTEADIKAYLKSDLSIKEYVRVINPVISVLPKENDGYLLYLQAIEAQKASLLKKNPNITAEALRKSTYTGCFEDIAQTEVVAAYKGGMKFDGSGKYTGVVNKTSFLWIKNVWVTDAMYKNPVLEYRDFETAIATKNGCSCSTTNKAKDIPAYSKIGYNTVTEKLDKQKDQFNGYFVLIALSIGTILLQQFISMRSQKEQQKYSSVDGQGAGQQKMMMVMMTGMFAIFSFMYSSAFSIYLIVSNLFSMGSTVIINKIVDKSVEKKEAKAAEEKFEKRYGGRVAAAKEAGKKAAQASKNKKSVGKKDEKNKK